MGKIFYLFGKSSTGKDTISKRILEHYKGSLKTLVPYTTRPIRSGEEEGREYHFVSDEEFERLLKAGDIIEYREYNTVHGLWRYFTVNDSQLEGVENEDRYLIIGVLESFVSTQKYFGKSKVVPIYIEVDDGERLQRALNRERGQKNPKYEEMCRRFLADAADFSEEKLLKAGIEERYKNDDLEKCVDRIIWRIDREVEEPSGV